VETERSRPVDERVAAMLRTDIYAGKYGPGDALPSGDRLAGQLDIRPPTLQRVFDILRREGLVRTEQGRGTFVCERHAYRAVVTAELPGRAAPRGGSRAITRALAQAEKGEPAISGLDFAVDPESGIWAWSMTVEAADTGPAAAVALATVRTAGLGGQLGWNLGVSVIPFSRR
jgi:GntR family transcriptional regulator